MTTPPPPTAPPPTTAHATAPTDALVCAIMAGGSGTRFWPVSRKARPKQLVALLDDHTLLRHTVARIAPLCPAERTLIITAARLSSAVEAELPELPKGHVISEPMPRNTAPCMALAAHAALQVRKDAILALLPADHHVADPTAFTAALALACAHARDGAIVTLGITPTRPETGFGYIELGEDVGNGARAVARFVEKPDVETALGYLAGGKHLWNGGVFVLRADIALSAMQAHQPATFAALAPLAEPDAPRLNDPAFAALLASRFGACPAISIDYGVMEHRDDLRCVPLSAGWSDVGTWASLLDHRADDATNFTKGRVLDHDNEGCVLLADGPAIAAIGLRDIVVATTDDAVLVMPASRSQDVRALIDAMKRGDAPGFEELL